MLSSPVTRVLVTCPYVKYRVPRPNIAQCRTPMLCRTTSSARVDVPMKPVRRAIHADAVDGHAGRQRLRDIQKRIRRIRPVGIQK